MRTVLREVIVGWGAASLWLFAVCGCKTICILPPVPQSYRPGYVIDEWIGFTSTSTELYRLVLDADSTGVLTEAFTAVGKEETLRFEISTWDFTTNGVLTCKFPKGAIHDPIKMECSVSGDRLESVLQNGRGGWRQEITFWRAKALEEKLKVLQE